MTEYYQLSTDYELAYQLLSDGQPLAAWMVFESSPKQLRVFSICDQQLFIDGQKLPFAFSYEKHCVQFLLPIPDPTIALQHSLTAALNECDALRNEKAYQKELLEQFRIAVNSDNKAETIRLLQIQIEGWQAMSEGANEAIEELRAEKKDLNHELEIVRDSERIIEKNNEELTIKLKEQERIISDLKIQIEGRDAALRGSTKTFKDLMQKNAKLEANLLTWEEFASDLHKELSSKIAILEDNLTRSESDRLSELTSIMRMLQAWESVPIQKWSGALHLIKRVIYEQICRLDPSQSLEL
jgi:chromosome segregation ATPase